MEIPKQRLPEQLQFKLSTWMQAAVCITFFNFEITFFVIVEGTGAQQAYLKYLFDIVP
jgi:hypothetical protein